MATQQSVLLRSKSMPNLKDGDESWKQVAEMINIIDGRLAKSMLENLMKSLKNAVSARMQEQTDRESPQERFFVQRDGLDENEVSAADQALLENDYTLAEIQKAKNELFKRKQNPNEASAAKLAGIIESMRAGKGKRDEMTDIATDNAKYADQFETKEVKELCECCAATLAACPNECGKKVVARVGAAGRKP